MRAKARAWRRRWSPELGQHPSNCFKYNTVSGCTGFFPVGPGSVTKSVVKESLNILATEAEMLTDFSAPRTVAQMTPFIKSLHGQAQDRGDVLDAE